MKTSLIRYFMAAALAAVVLVTAQAANPQAQAVSMTFAIGSDCKVSIPGKQNATAADLKQGDKVGVKYTNTNGSLSAQNIHVSDGQKLGGPGKKPGPPPGGTSKPEGLHAHGVITSVSATSLIIEAHQPPPGRTPAAK